MIAFISEKAVVFIVGVRNKVMLEAKNNQQVELIKVAEQGDIDAQQELVRIFSKRGSAFKQEFETEQDLVKAFVWLKKLAENGDQNALHCLADSYFQGYGIKKSPLQAVALLEELADKNDVVALFRLSDYYFYGKEVEKNYSQAVIYLEKLSQGESDFKERLSRNQLHWGFGFGSVFDTYVYVDNEYLADNNLADCYFQGGYGLEKNIPKALVWLEKAANKGSVNAMLKLADCYLTGSEGVAINKDNVVKWLEAAAESGNQNAQHRLVDYLNEVGNEESFKKRFELIETWVSPENMTTSLHKNINKFWAPVNEKRDHLLLYKYANCFYFGRGVEKSYENAVKWFKEASQSESASGFEPEKKGLARAQTALGICYFYGYGVEKNDGEAIKWFTAASKQNDAVGYLWLAFLIGIEIKQLESDIEASEIPMLFLVVAISHSADIPQEERLLREKVEKIDHLKQEFIESLKKAAINSIYVKNTNYYDINIVKRFFSKEIIDFLENNKNSQAKVILAFYYQCKKEDETKLSFLKKSSEEHDIIANCELGKYYKELRDFDKAIEYFENTLNPNCFSNYDIATTVKITDFATQEISNIKSFLIYEKGLEEKNKEIQKNKEVIERMMGEFEHSFRTPLSSITSCINHKTSLKLCKQKAQMMLGMLELIKVISTDDELLKKNLALDIKGAGTINSVLIGVIDDVLLHLLSVSGVIKIQQHYIAYAKAHGKIDCSIDAATWEEKYFDLEHELQVKWEQEFFLLTEQQASLKSRLEWIEKHFFKLNLIGFNELIFKFKEYSIKESFFTVIFTEILLNTFKYYDSENKKFVSLEWNRQGNYQVLKCHNPTSDDTSMLSKGSHKGHEFMCVLANKIGGGFLFSKIQDDFTVEFRIPNNILGINNESLLMD